MAPEEQEDREERIALIADGCRVSQPEAEAIYASWWTTKQAQESREAFAKTAQARKMAPARTPNANKVVGSFYGRS